ncbi:MAG: LysR family transcriptional regulator [Nevskiaceae bacterium]|nr:MAG: LysR family transcriptional regulator [Nevskiaceae bacterium]TBR72029.1 MAG: LysR family transcriptional regulator [Nevskiaceae bacterium]
MTESSDPRAPRISLEQWRVLCAVVEQGGYAPAAEHLHKSQSAITYAIQKLERLLSVPLFALSGRRAVLTPAGHLFHRRAVALLAEATALEGAATRLAGGWEAEIRLAADIVFPTWLLLKALDLFAGEQPATRIELFETVLGGTEEALLERRADLVISPTVPQGFLGDPLMDLRFIAVAAPGHPLHAASEPLTYQDLRRHRQLVIRDSGLLRKRDAGWLGSEARWTVTHKATSIRAVCMGMGFAWFAEDMIREELVSGALKPLRLREGAERHATLYLIFPDRDYAGPGAQRLAELIGETVRGQG